MKADFSQFKKLFGDLMPELSPGPRGRHRLVLALTQRFGEHFRMNAEAQGALKYFDSETQRIRAHLIAKGASHG